MPDFSVEDKKRQLDFNNIAGVDEAGRGPWAGPVYSAIVILNRNCIPEGINDSKKISEKKRIELYEEILINHNYGIGCASPDEIDQLNLSLIHISEPTRLLSLSYAVVCWKK